VVDVDILAECAWMKRVGLPFAEAECSWIVLSGSSRKVRRMSRSEPSGSLDDPRERVEPRGVGDLRAEMRRGPGGGTRGVYEVDI
jgi:hypothetical protein